MVSDLDGTLAESRASLDMQMANLLKVSSRDGEGVRFIRRRLVTI